MELIGLCATYVEGFGAEDDLLEDPLEDEDAQLVWVDGENSGAAVTKAATVGKDEAALEPAAPETHGDSDEAIATAEMQVPARRT